MRLLGILAGATLTAAQVADAPTYCLALLTACPNVHGLPDQTTCENLFAGFTAGNVTDVNVNTIGCRYNYLVNPALNTTATKCQYAGPTGGGRCGSVVNSVCMMALNACPGGTSGSAYADVPTCEAGLGNFPLNSQWGYNQGAAALGEDTMECRVYQTIHAVVSANTAYCANFAATGGTCSGPVQPNAVHYCETVTYWCTDPWDTQYPGPAYASCLNSTGAFSATPADARASNPTNSLGCREYHAQAAGTVNASFHCQHAGPSGGGVCGTYTEAWGSLSQNNCNDGTVNAAILGMGEANMGNAIPVGMTGAYSVAGTNTTADTQQCRIYHLTVAATQPTAHCIHGTLSGGAFCGKDEVSNLCTFINGICPFGNNASWQFASQQACYSGLTGIAVGGFQGSNADASTNTLGCRFYHASVAGQYLAGGALSNGTGATALYQQHCSHVLPITPPGGCNVLPPTASSSTTISVLGALAATLLCASSL